MQTAFIDPDDFDHFTCPICGKKFIPSKCQFDKYLWYHKHIIEQNCFDLDEFYCPTCCTSCRTKFTLQVKGDRLNTQEAQDKAKQTNIERYGCANPWEKGHPGRLACEKTNIERYGHANVLENGCECREKAKETNIERYGAEHNWMAKSTVRQEQDKNFEKEWGAKTPFESSKWQEYARQRMQEKYGAKSPIQVPKIAAQIASTNLEKYGAAQLFASPSIQKKIQHTIQEVYGFDYFCQHPDCINANGHRISKLNTEFAKELQDLGIDTQLEYTIDNVGYDILIKDKNIVIELNPTYTHSSTVGPHWRPDKPLPTDYHFNKSTIAKKAGLHCIHIFDWDNKHKIAKSLKSHKSLGARQLEIWPVDIKEVNLFIDQYHFQNQCKGTQIAYGLYYNTELVQVMTFGRPRYNKNYQWELLRLCTYPNYSVAGGASKLLQHFIKLHNPESIISYCDLSKFTGKVYEQIGMTYSHSTNPTRHWYNPKSGKHITDALLRMRGADQLLGTSYGKGTNNDQIMREHGFHEIYDCGQAVYIWTNKGSDS